MPRRAQLIEARFLPHGWGDLARQLGLFAIAYGGYEIVRGLVATDSYKPFGDATRIIDFERALHVFAEPSVQTWAENRHLVIELADFAYLNAHYVVTIAALVFVYLRRNDSFYFVRNMFMVAMGIALVGYVAYPTAPPRLLPAWGFTDSIRQFTGISVDKGPGSALLNLYAAVPSMHVCFSLMIGFPMARLVRRRWARLLWLLYPLLISFVVVATGNHYFTDVFLGAVSGGLAALTAQRLFARARPQVWAFTSVPATP